MKSRIVKPNSQPLPKDVVDMATAIGTTSRSGSTDAARRKAPARNRSGDRSVSVLVPSGQISTLTFTIDNGVNAFPVANLAFNDNLPVGVLFPELPDGLQLLFGVFLVSDSQISVGHGVADERLERPPSVPYRPGRVL